MKSFSFDYALMIEVEPGKNIDRILIAHVTLGDFSNTVEYEVKNLEQGTTHRTKSLSDAVETYEAIVLPETRSVYICSEKDPHFGRSYFLSWTNPTPNASTEGEVTVYTEKWESIKFGHLFDSYTEAINYLEDLGVVYDCLGR